MRPDGRKGIYSVLERSSVNFIIALDYNSAIYFIKEFRYPVSKTILQLPAGSTEKNRSPLLSAKKELWEETGIKAGDWKKLGSFFIGPGHENVKANVFLATKLDTSKINKLQHLGDELILDCTKLPISKIKRLIKENKIECGITLAALNLFFIKYNK